MTLELIRATLGWCSAINIAMLLLWGLFFLFGRNWMYRFHGSVFKMSEERFNAIHYAGMAFYKILIFVFNLVPYLALRIIG